MTNVNLKKVNDKNKPAINLFFIDFDLSNIDENGVQEIPEDYEFVHP